MRGLESLCRTLTTSPSTALYSLRLGRYLLSVQKVVPIERNVRRGYTMHKSFPGSNAAVHAPHNMYSQRAIGSTAVLIRVETERKRQVLCPSGIRTGCRSFREIIESRP